MSTKKRNSPAPAVPPVPPDANAPEVTAPTAVVENEHAIVVAEEVLRGIFNDDPKGKYFSNDGETFLNEEQFERLEDKSGYEKFEK